MLERTKIHDVCVDLDLKPEIIWRLGSACRLNWVKLAVRRLSRNGAVAGGLGDRLCGGERGRRRGLRRVALRKGPPRRPDAAREAVPPEAWLSFSSQLKRAKL